MTTKKGTKMELPNQLKNPEFRFFLLQSNGKKPIEKLYNSVNCYPFFHSKIKNHTGNIGILTGIGNLCVIDFDDREFYKSKQTLKSMPKTFCVKTPNKKLYHLYYMLYAEKFNTQGIDINGKRVVDIMSTNGRVVCPPSTISSMPYEVVTDLPIATITIEQLQKIFNISTTKARIYKPKTGTINPNAFTDTINILLREGIERTSENKFVCPFHESSNRSNLAVFPDGGMKCFHCERYFSSAKYFLIDLVQHRREKEFKTKELMFE